jgi:hypothetical protein
MMKRVTVLSLIALAMVFSFANPAWSKMTRSVTPDEKGREKGEVSPTGGTFETRRGFQGWKSSSPQFAPKGSQHRLMAPALDNGLPAEKGTLVFWCYLDRSLQPGEWAYEPLLSLAGEDGSESDLFNLYIEPNYSDNTAMSALNVHGDFASGGKNIYGQVVLLPKKLPIRKWFTVSMTWGPNPQADNRLFVDNVEASAYLNYDHVTPASRTVPLSVLIKKAKRVVIGAEAALNWSFRLGLIGEIQVYDEILTSFNFPPRGAPVIKSFSDDSFKVPGISGKLVAGDKITVTMESEAGGKASFDMGDLRGVPLAEGTANSGKYAAVFVVPPGRLIENGKLVGRFVDESGMEAEPVTGRDSFSVDSRSRFAMVIDKTDLPADSSATARVKVKVTDANGNPVKDHQIKVTLSTTDEYTGLVGGGSTRYRDAAAAAKDLLAGADVEMRWKGITDSWGEVEFDFKSGFAAKTIVLQAKDMTSGNVGVDYITSYKEASIDIVLTSPISRAAARRGLQYIIKVEATRTELTADGRSRSVIRATVQDPNGKPVSGDAVVFSLSSANGTLRTISGVTDAAGVATAEYTAGKKIGIVVVTATDTVRNISASVSITLLADAPAKILLKARPETMPADGNSRADIGVKVTDINDNPNKDTKVEFRLSRGSGKLDYPDRVTDRFGDTLNRFIAGSTPGIATIVATVRSKVPTVEELAKAQNVLFVPYSDLGEEIRINKWLKRKGDTAMKGEPIVEYTFGRGDAVYTLNAPYDCRVDFQFVEYWDNAKTGDTLAQLTPVVITGSPNPPPTPPVLSPRRR